MNNEPTVEIASAANKKLIRELRAMDTHNRKRKHNHVEYLRKQIREGKFGLTNQGVGVAVSKFIIDGGHRLEAFELEGFPPVLFILARNLPDDSQKYVDQHAKRTMSDTLTLFLDLSISGRVVACLNVIRKKIAKWGPGKISADELVEEFQEKQEAILKVHSMEKASTLSAPVTACIVDVFHETRDERVLAFADQVMRGEMLQAGDPAMTLRNWLATNTGASGGSSVQRERYLKTRAAVTAYLENRRLTKLYVAGD